MVFRPRILQDVAEYAIQTADRDLSASELVSEPRVPDQPTLLSRSDRTSAHLTSASAIALGPWAVFALSFLILAAYGEDFEAALEAPLADTLDLDELGKFSAALTGEPDPIPMFGQVTRSTGQVATLGSNSTLDAPSFSPEPGLLGPSIGPFALALVPDEAFGRGARLADGLNSITDDRDNNSLIGDDSGISTQLTPVQFEGDDDDEGNGEDGEGGGGPPEDGGGGPPEEGPGEGEDLGDISLVISGGIGDDVLVGSNLSDAIFGRGGDDSITGKGGNDILVAGPGNDSLDGSGGFDIAAFSDPSRDFVIHRNTDGTFTVENHATGDETKIVNVEALYFNDGFYTISELPDDFGRLVTEGLLDTTNNTQNLLDEAGVGEGDDDGDGDGDGGDAENDFINGTSGDDNLIGTNLGDVIFGFSGNDQLAGLAGDDILVTGPGNDTADGGIGFDIAAFEDASFNYTIYRNEDGSFTVENDETGEETQLISVESLFFTDGNYDLTELPDGIGVVDTSGQLDTAKTTYTLIDEVMGGGDSGGGGEINPDLGIDGEIIEGSSGNDNLVGTEFDDLIFGGPGDDRIFGMQGDDIIVSEPGSDRVDGGEGDDIAAFQGPSSQYRLFANADGSFQLSNTRTEDETPLFNVESIFFNDGFLDLDEYEGPEGPVDIAELLNSASTTQDLMERFNEGGEGDGGEDDHDILVPVPDPPGEPIEGDERDNELLGTEGDDVIIGAGGDDLLLGKGGDDVLLTEPGNDRVFGGSGNDTAAFKGLASGYAVYLLSDGSVSVINGLTEEETVLIDVEQVYFRDGFIDLTRIDEIGLVDSRGLLNREDNTLALMERIEQAGNEDDGEGDDEEEGDGGGLTPALDNSGSVVNGDDKGNDLRGTDLSDIISGFGGNDRIAALGGDDVLAPGSGNNLLDGGDGKDVAAVDDPSSAYALYKMSDGSFSVVHNQTEEETILVNVEQLYFSDGSIDLAELKDAAGSIDIKALLNTARTTEDLPLGLDGENEGGEKDGGDKGGGEKDGPESLGFLITGDAGDNDLFGTDNSDFFYGGPGNDRISGFAGEDIIIADPGSDMIDGGDGFDIAGFAGSSRDYTLTQNRDGSFTVSGAKSEDATQLVSVENIHFADGNIDLTGLPGREGVVFMGDLLDTESTVEDLIRLSGSYEEPLGAPEGDGEDGEDDGSSAPFVLMPPPLSSTVNDENGGEKEESEGEGASEPFVLVPPSVIPTFESDYNANPITGETS